VVVDQYLVLLTLIVPLPWRTLPWGEGDPRGRGTGNFVLFGKETASGLVPYRPESWMWMISSWLEVSCTCRSAWGANGAPPSQGGKAHCKKQLPMATVPSRPGGGVSRISLHHQLDGSWLQRPSAPRLGGGVSRKSCNHMRYGSWLQRPSASPLLQPTKDVWSLKRQGTPM
jgi:hypothetical protein